jgi:phage shock protein E
MMRTGLISLALIGLGFAAGASADPAASNSPPQIDYPGFAALTDEVGAFREGRLVDLEQFQGLAQAPGALILDARSADKFAEGHIQGAVNLPFSDFTDEALARVIGDRARTVLIYCNNNFANNVAPIMLKRAPLALNIPTFINLYGYGYRNIYELGDRLDMNDPRVHWVAS